MKSKKIKKMPDLNNLTTIELLEGLAQYVHTSGQAIYAEIMSRKVEASDADDTPSSRGGIRPYNAPVVP
jgi:hypothetical protein